MSIEKCTRCDKFINTDFDCEVYREEFDSEVICDTCYDKCGLQAESLEATLSYFNRYIAGDR